MLKILIRLVHVCMYVYISKFDTVVYSASLLVVAIVVQLFKELKRSNLGAGWGGGVDHTPDGFQFVSKSQVNKQTFNNVGK